MLKKLLHRLLNTSSAKLSVWIFILSSLFRSLYVYYFYYKFGYSQFGDDIDYISYAQQIKAQGFTVPDIDKIYGNGHQVGIGWPLIIFFIFGLFGEKYWLVFIL